MNGVSLITAGYRMLTQDAPIIKIVFILPIVQTLMKCHIQHSFFSSLLRLGPSIYCLLKTYQRYQAPPKKFEIFATPKNIPIIIPTLF